VKSLKISPSKILGYTVSEKRFVSFHTVSILSNSFKTDMLTNILTDILTNILTDILTNTLTNIL